MTMKNKNSPPLVDVEIQRLVEPARFDLLNHMIIEPGDKTDWETLHELHYKSTGRTAGRVYRISLKGDLVGCVVMTSPRGLLKARHDLFPILAAGGGDTRITNVHRFKWLNQNMCLNSRTVVDTMYRGIGVAVRALNLAARIEGKRFAEIQSSMSRYNLFAQKAGFVFTKPRRSPYYEEGIAFFGLHFDCNPIDYVALKNELAAKSEAERKGLEPLLRNFYYFRSSLEKQGVGDVRLEKKRRVMEDMAINDVLRNTQQLVFAMPEYGVYTNPDFGRVIPKTLPLAAFDRQETDQPLILLDGENRDTHG